MAYPTEYRYTKEHEWIVVKDGIATIGITDYAQHELGDVVFVELPKAGAKLAAGKIFGSVESVKAVSEIFAPASGDLVKANAALQEKPETLNTDPHGAGWFGESQADESANSLPCWTPRRIEAFIAEKQKEASS